MYQPYDIVIFKGCSEALQKFVKGKMAVIGGIGVGIAILQVRNNLSNWIMKEALLLKREQLFWSFEGVALYQ